MLKETSVVEVAREEFYNVSLGFLGSMSGHRSD